MAPPAEEWVYLDLLQEMATDREEGRRHPLAVYLARHPGREEAVARAFVDLDRCAGPPPAAALENGSELIGPYRLIRELGRGGQGVVHLAEDTRVERQVALKVLQGMGPLSEQMLARFRREVLAASRVDHPGICTVYEAEAAGDQPYIAMKYVAGSSLAQLIAQTQRLRASGTRGPVATIGTQSREGGVAENRDVGASDTRAEKVSGTFQDRTRAVLHLLEGAARCLHAAHQAGIIHRDIKPGNIMVTPEGRPVILDFGLARATEGKATTITQPGEVLGTPAYMSPEQLGESDLPLDRRTDVWSLGVVLYESLTLERPFRGATRAGLWRAIVSQDPLALRALDPRFTPALEAVVDTALQKDLARRYQSAAALADDLKALLEDRPVSVRPPGRRERFLRAVRRHPALATLSLLLALAVMGLGGVGGFLLAKREVIRAGEEARLHQRMERLLCQGFLELGHGHPGRAAPLFHQVMEEGGPLPEALGGLALARLQQGEGRQALALFEEHPDAAQRHAGIRRLRRQAEQALGMLPPEGEDEEEPRSALDHFLWGLLDLQAGHHGEREAYSRALFHLRRALETSRESRAFYVMEAAHAAGHSQESDVGAALAAFLTRTWPEFPETWYWAGYARLIAEPPAALEAFEEAIRRRPRFALAHHHRGNALQMCGRIPEALAAQDVVLELQPDLHHAWRERGLVLEELGRDPEAEESLARALELEPDDGVARAQLARLRLRRGAFPEAKATAASLAETGLDDAGRLSNLALDFHGAGDLDISEALWRRAVAQHPAHFQSFFNLGSVLAGQGRLAEAVEFLQRAVELQGTTPKYCLQLGQALEGLGRRSEALAVYREATERLPEEGELWVRLGAALEQVGHFGESLAAYEKARELGALEPGDPLEAAETLRQVRRLAGLERELERRRAEGWGALSPEERLALAEVAARKGLHLCAARLFRQVFEEAPALSRREQPSSLALAAEAAAGAARGVGPESRFLSRESRETWCTQALAWLELELRAWEDAVQRDTRRSRAVRRVLSGWLDGGVLDPAHDAELPTPPTAGLWRAFRERVVSVLDGLESR